MQDNKQRRNMVGRLWLRGHSLKLPGTASIHTSSLSYVWFAAQVWGWFLIYFLQVTLNEPGVKTQSHPKHVCTNELGHSDCHTDTWNDHV